MTSVHRLRISFNNYEDPGKWYGACSCGWIGVSHRTRKAVRTEHSAHRNRIRSPITDAKPSEKREKRE